jgi:tetratricopeptide (TPR) repeat protein
MPAFNQLAVYYLQSAQKKAGKTKGKVRSAAGKEKKADSQALELAALVCSQALRKNPNYAPVHNTSGLISAELGDLSAAARAFGTARKLDAKFFEAHMNYAAVNLQFRGFAQAEEAYRQALALKGNDYEAHLGLALAVRGQISDSNFDKNLKEAEGLLEKAKSLSPDRPETYYNQGILTQEFKARGGGEGQLKVAKDLYDAFKAKASGKSEFDAAVKVATERMEEIDQIMEFNKQSAEEQKRMEAMRRAEEAKEQLEKGK